MSSLSTSILLKAPVVYWKLDEASGSVVADYGSNTRNAACYGSYTRGTLALNYTPDADEKSFRLAGGGYAKDSGCPNTGVTTPFSVFGMFKRTAGTGGALFHSGDGYYTAHGVRFVCDTTGALAVYYVGGGGYNRGNLLGCSLPDGTACSVSFVYAGGTTLYATVNGVEYLVALTSPFDASGAHFSTGARVYNGSYDSYFTGDIDEVAWFNRELTYAESQHLHFTATVEQSPAFISWGTSSVTTEARPVVPSEFSSSGVTTFMPETSVRDIDIFSSSILTPETEIREFNISAGADFTPRPSVPFYSTAGATTDFPSVGALVCSFSISGESLLTAYGQINATFLASGVGSVVVGRGYVQGVAFTSAADGRATFYRAYKQNAEFSSAAQSSSTFKVISANNREFYADGMATGMFPCEKLVWTEFSGSAQTTSVWESVLAGVSTASSLAEGVATFASTYSFENIPIIPDDADVVFVKTQTKIAYVTTI